MGRQAFLRVIADEEDSPCRVLMVFCSGGGGEIIITMDHHVAFFLVSEIGWIITYTNMNIYCA